MEGGTFVSIANVDEAIVLRYDPPTHVQANSGAGPHVFGREVKLKDPFAEHRRNAAAAVRDLDDELLILRTGDQTDPTAGFCGLRTVHKKVGEDAHHHLLGAPDRTHIGLVVTKLDAPEMRGRDGSRSIDDARPRHVSTHHSA